jgi:coenzyme F420-reducing hydrogenase delta subunit
MLEMREERYVAEGLKFNILAYCCEHCAYAAADLAGGLRMRYPPSIKVVHLPCSGRVEPALLLKAFEEGADGILVAG